MDIGKRIKARRKELGLSAEDVAERMGVSPATIYRYESNYISNMGIDKITPIANALNTSESYLLGWTDNTTTELKNCQPNLDSFQKRLLAYCNALNELGKTKALDYMDDLVSSGNYSALSNLDFLTPVAAHESTDIEISEEDRKRDLDILNSDDF